MSAPLVNIGILSTANIARKNWLAAKLSGNARIAGVASRSVQSAEKFISECSSQVPQIGEVKPYGSYEELLADKTIDAVYIPLPTGLRREWVVKAAQAGKHILAEKPAAKNLAEVDEMLAACKENSVQYMDGVMFMHSARLPMISEVIHQQKQLGDLKRLASQFSFGADEDFIQNNIRMSSELEPHGCLGDLGWYCIRYFTWLMQGAIPEQVRGRTIRSVQNSASPEPVPVEFSAELDYAGGVTASFYCAFTTQHQQWVHVSGTEGYLRVDDFVLPYHAAEVGVTVGHDHFAVDNCRFHMEKHQQTLSVHEYDAGDSSAQEVKMLRNFAAMVQSGELQDEWPIWTRKTQAILDACFDSANAGSSGMAVGL